MTDPNLDELAERHKNESQQMHADDIKAAAQLFNAVGSQLKTVDSMQVEGNNPAFKLDKRAIVGQPVAPATPPPPPQSITPPHPGNTVQPVNTIHTHQPTSIQSPVVTVDHKTYTQQLKKIDSMSRKLNKIEKDFNQLKDVMKIKNIKCKYAVTDGDNSVSSKSVEMLIGAVSEMLASGTKEINITKCS